MKSNNSIKKVLTILLAIILITISACGKKDDITPSTDNTPSTTISSDNTTTSDEPKEDTSYLSKTLILTPDSSEVEVYWMDNDSVKELKKLVYNRLTTITLTMNDYDQVGPLTSGVSIALADTIITTSAGDICLYNGDQLVIFYGTHSGKYTKLGHINITKTELVELLTDEDSIDITLKLK